jgi:hypothetical protein
MPSPPPETHISSNSICINVEPSSIGASSESNSNPLKSTPTTVFLIPGNPGLISYYHTFLSLLSRYLQVLKDEKNSSPATGVGSSEEPAAVHPGFRICGASLGGFDIEDRSENDAEKADTDDASKRKRLYGLGEQIEFVEGSLENAIKSSLNGQAAGSQDEIVSGDQSSPQERKARVILMGHSVGAYIAMEVLRRHRERETRRKTLNTSSGLADCERDSKLDQIDIIGAVLLFPTVVDIAKSPSGKKLTVRSKEDSPFLLSVAGF